MDNFVYSWFILELGDNLFYVFVIAVWMMHFTLYCADIATRAHFCNEGRVRKKIKVNVLGGVQCKEKND